MGICLRFALVLLLLPGLGIAHAAEADRLVLYPAYGDARAAVVEGRVIEQHASGTAHVSDSWWTNLRRHLRALINDERDGAAVSVNVDGREFRVKTDEEGYFKLAIAGPLATGWHVVTGRTGDYSAHGALLVVPAENTLGIISDLDDTIQVSEVTHKRRLLKNTFLKNPLQRQAVHGAALFYHSLATRNPQPDAAPVIYLSASPRQIQESIQLFLEQNRFPRGVLITKKVTNDDSSEPLADQIAYKTAKIEEVLTRLPQVRFVLVGDDGERDPEIYHEIRARYPGRVEAVYIRRVHPDSTRAVFPDQSDLSRALSAAHR